MMAALYARRFNAASEPILEALEEGRHISKIQGITAYRKNLIFGLLGAMKHSYPMCHSLLCENNFNFLCREYILSHPSNSANLLDFGEHFPEFLASRSETVDFPYLADIARLEWYVERVQYCEEELACSQEEVQSRINVDSSLSFEAVGSGSSEKITQPAR